MYFPLALSTRVFFARLMLEVVNARAGRYGIPRTLLVELDAGPELKERKAADGAAKRELDAEAVELDILSRRTQAVHSLLRDTIALMTLKSDARQIQVDA